MGKGLRIVLMAAAILGAVGGWLIGGTAAPAREGVVAVEPARIQLSAVPTGADSVTTRVLVTNHTAVPRRLAGKASCGCMGLEPGTFTLAPGATQSVEIHLTASRDSSGQTVTVRFMDVDAGTVLAAATVLVPPQKRLAAGQSVVHARLDGAVPEERVRFDVRNLTEEAFEGLVRIEGPAAEFVAPLSDLVTFPPQATSPLTLVAEYPGHRRIRGRVTVADSSGRIALEADVLVSGESPYVIDPPALLIPASGSNRPYTAAVRIQRRDGAPFRILSIAGEAFEAEPEWRWTDGRNVSHEVTLAFPRFIQGQGVLGTVHVATDGSDFAGVPPVRVVAVDPAVVAKGTGTV